MPRTEVGSSEDLLAELSTWVTLETPTTGAGAAGLPKQRRGGGGSDRNFTAALGTPTLDWLGCPGAGPLAGREHILWRHLAPRAALMAGLLEELDP